MNATRKGNEMTATQQLERISQEYAKQLHAINQLSLVRWIELAKQLNVELNDREHAAKKLAIRKLAAN